jgi:hypothetical protein
VEQQLAAVCSTGSAWQYRTPGIGPPHARWSGDARLTLGYARGGHAACGHVADTAGLIATAAAQAAHAVLAGRGEWITNEKALLDRAGLRSVDAVISGLAADPEHLTRAVDAAERLLGLSPSAHGNGRGLA